MKKDETKSPPSSSTPMTRRDADGRPHMTDEMEQRAADAQKASRDEPRPAPLPVNGPPD